jgi:hypothetical protein
MRLASRPGAYKLERPRPPSHSVARCNTAASVWPPAWRAAVSEGGAGGTNGRREGASAPVASPLGMEI